MNEKQESYRLRQIKILQLAKEVTERTKYKPADYQDAQCARSLVDSGHIFGDVKLPIDCAPFVIFIGITTDGHNLLEDLLEKERESKFYMRAWRFLEKSAVFIITAGAAAIIGAMAPGWFQSLFH